MIVDTSALIAILRDEPDGQLFFDALVDAIDPRISAATLLEASIVADRTPSPLGGRRFDRLVRDMRLTVVPVTQDQVTVARAAYRDFGKGSGHRAGLNYGDCFSYALAATSGEPLLYKGDDFRHTDVPAVLTRY